LATTLNGTENKIAIDGVSNLIYINNAAGTASYKELKDRAYFSEENNCLYIKRKYFNNLNFKVNFSDGTNFTTELIYANN